MSKRDRNNGVPETVTSIPLVDPHALPDNPSIGDLVRDATTQVSTLVRAEVELAKSEITRDVKRGLTGSVFFIVAGVVLLYSTFFMFFFLAELLDTWLWRWAAFLIVFLLMLAVTGLFAFLGYRKVRKIRGPQQTIESVRETTAALTPGLQKFGGGGHPAVPSAPTVPAVRPTPRPAVTSAPVRQPAPTPAPAPKPAPVEPARFEVEAYSDETAYSAETVHSAETVTYEPAPDDEDTAILARGALSAEAVSYEADSSDAPTGPIPPIPVDTDDPTAAIYAETGLPVTPEHQHEREDRPSDPSGA